MTRAIPSELIRQNTKSYLYVFLQSPRGGRHLCPPRPYTVNQPQRTEEEWEEVI